jgi:phosphate transport system protein
MQMRKEIDKLKKNLLALSALVEDSVFKAVRAVQERNEILAREIIDHDPVIDQREVDLEEECLKVLALHQPVAIDLRYIVAILKINNDLERIGDLAVNIAERAVALAREEPLDFSFDIGDMSGEVETMLKKCLNSLMDLDAELAYEVIDLDDKVDGLNRGMISSVLESIRKYPDRADCLILFISVSRNLERIADQATNIAEDVIYMVEGEIVRHRLGDKH